MYKSKCLSFIALLQIHLVKSLFLGVREKKKKNLSYYLRSNNHLNSGAQLKAGCRFSLFQATY